MASSGLSLSSRKKAVLLDQHNVLQSHWSSAGLNHGESDHTYKHHVAQLMSIYTEHDKKIVDMKLPKKAYISPVTRLYGARGLRSSAPEWPAIYSKREKKWNNRMYLTANINRSRQLETEKQEHQQRTSDSENSNTQYHSNIYNNHIHMQDLELNEASYLGNENPYYSNGIGKVHNKSTRRPQSASAINSKRLGSILEFKGANPNFDHNNPAQPSSAYDMRHRTLPVESMGILNDPTDMKNAMNTTHVSGHHHHNVRPPLPLSHAQGYIDSEDEMEQREKPQSPYNAQGSIKLGEHSTSSAAEEEGEELILKGQYRFDEAEADIYNKFVLMLTNFDVHDVLLILKDALHDTKVSSMLDQYGGTSLSTTNPNNNRDAIDSPTRRNFENSKECKPKSSKINRK